MKKNISKKLVPFGIMLASLTTFSSCNRGVGCPNNFSIGDSFSDIIELVASAVQLFF